MRAIGIDTGGTFTDIVRIDGNGTVGVDKAASTPDDYARGVMDAIELAIGSGSEQQDEFKRITSVTLGTTIATNALLTRTGARVGLLTTVGHGDTLRIMRVFGRVAGRRPTEFLTYANTDKPPPIVAREATLEIRERIDATGKVIVPLRDDEVLQSLSELATQGVEIIVVAFLWSFLNPSHERRVGELMRQHFPKLGVVLSCEVASRIGEYERTNTAVVEAFVRPSLSKYLHQVRSGLEARQISCPFLVMHSTGGVGTQEYTEAHAVATSFSGPAGGVIGAQRVGEMLGHSNIICTDVGGTSFDVALIVDGRPLLRTTTTIDQRVMYVPSIDIVSIGAGGGSIAQVADGSLKVGPESAGSFPGPACYGRGGLQPTVTDANLLLGLMNPDRFLSGRAKLNTHLAQEAMRTYVGRPLDLDTVAAAKAIFAIANAKMADLIRSVTVERGLDPRDFVLYGYGGLGPLHAPFYGEDLQVKSIVIPLGKISSVFSAFGIAVSDIGHVFEITAPLTSPFDGARIDAIFRQLMASAQSQLAVDKIDHADRRFRRFVDMRYRGQLSELSVGIGGEAPLSGGAFDLTEAFEARYLQEFGVGSLLPGAPTEITTFRIEAVGKRHVPGIAAREQLGGPREFPARHIEEIHWPLVGKVATDVFEGSSLNTGSVISGPAIVDLGITSAAVPPGWQCVADRWGNLELRQVRDGME